MKLFGADLGSLTHLPLLILLFSAESQVTHRPVFTTRHWSDNTVRIRYSWDFPWSPVVRTPHFHCREYGFDPWSGKWDPTCLMAQPPLPKILLIIFMFIRSLGRSLSAYQTITSLLLFGISGMGSDQDGPGWSISPGLEPSVLAAGDLTLSQYDVVKNFYVSNWFDEIPLFYFSIFKI